MESIYPELSLILARHNAGGYRLELRFSQPGSQGEVDPAAGQELRVDFDLTGLNTTASAIEYGQVLAQALFAPQAVRTALAQAQAVAASLNQPLRVRLEISPDSVELHSLHWETMADPGLKGPLFTGEKVLFSRYLSSAAWGPVTLRPRHELRALVVVANPLDLDFYSLDPVDVTGEVERARKSLKNIQADYLDGSSERVTLENLLKRLRQTRYDILYIVAHGALVKGDGWLWLEDEAGNSARVAGSELATQFQKLAELPILVVLMSCQSAGEASGTALTALGPRLAEAGAPAVLAMQGKISMETAAQFAPVFFQELADDGTLDRAVAVARNQVRNQPDFWMPALFTRLQTEMIYGEPGAVAVRPEEFNRLNRSLFIGLGALVVIMLVLSGFVLSGYKYNPKPRQMTGQFKVALVEFPVLDEQGKPMNSKVGQAVTDFISYHVGNVIKAMPNAIQTQFWDAAQTGKLNIEPGQTARQAANKLVDRINANILIYGVVQRNNHGAFTFTPQFVVKYPGAFANAPDLNGDNTLGGPVELTEEFTSEKLATEYPALIERIQALGYLTAGIGFYAAEQYDQAYQYFDTALKLPHWVDSAGKEIAYQLRGNTLALQDWKTDSVNRLQQARADYDKAWQISHQTFGRAKVGMASIDFMQAVPDWRNITPETVDDSLLTQSENQFNEASTLPDQPITDNVTAKVNLGLGQIYLVRGRLVEDEDAHFIDQAIEKFQAVIQEYLDGNDAIRDYTAQAYGFLGLIFSNIRINQDEAFSYYQQGFALASPFSKADFLGTMGTIRFDQALDAQAHDETAATLKFQQAEICLQQALQLAQNNLGDEGLTNEFQGILNDLHNEFGKYLENSEVKVCFEQ